MSLCICCFFFVICFVSVDYVVGFIWFGMIVGMSGFIGVGYFKQVLQVLVVCIVVVYECGECFGICMFIGVFIVLELDGVLVCIGGIDFCLFY